MQNIKSSGLLLGVVCVLLSAAQCPADASPRICQNWDFDWYFHLGEVGPDTLWRPVALPHDWSIEGALSQTAPAGGGGGYLPGGIGWYQKTFRLPQAMTGKKVSVQFDGVYQNSQVWINGHLLGKRPYGYISFAYDLTPYLKSDADNLIRVRVDNSLQPNSRWYSGSGIDRNVWLIATDPVRIAQWGTTVTTTQVMPDTATIRVRTQIENGGDAPADLTLVTSVEDASAQSTQSLAPSANHEFDQEIHVAHPHLWSVDDPYLYTVHSRLMRGDQVVDEYDTPIGIRIIDFDVEKGFLLNGHQVKLNGVCLHADGGAVGAAVPIGVWQRRLTLLKQMGCNAIRTSHNPPAPEFLDLCDKLGFLVMDEAFDEWEAGKGQIRYGYHLHYDDWWQRDVTDMVRRDRNHPCVVIWSCGNEIPDQLSARGPQLIKGLVDLFHELDPTRPVTAACDHAYSEPKSASPEFMGAMDVAGYNYADRWRDRADKYFSIDREAFPQRKFIGTEDGSVGGVRGDYRALFISAAPPARRGRGGGGFGSLSIARIIDAEQLWKFVRTYDYVEGDFMWTGIDYLGESFWPSHVATSGVLDTCGFKKDGYYFYQSQWTDTPMVHLFPHWNWAGKEGQFIPVYCFTNCDVVELFINGRSAGVKGYEFPREGMQRDYGILPPRARVPRTTSDLHLEWDIPYEPGTLKAVGYHNGKIAVTDEVSTTGAPAAIKLSSDPASITANRQDVAHVIVQIVDDHGRVVPDAENDVAFTIQGPARLIGVDNGNPLSHESYQAHDRTAFHGLCLAIVQATDQAGTIQVTAQSNGLQSATIEIQSH